VGKQEIGNVEEILDYFLRWGKLSDKINSLVNHEEVDFLLRNIMLHLFIHHTERFKSIWNIKAYKWNARFKLYDLFTGYANISEKEIVSFLNEQKENDIRLFINNDVNQKKVR